VLDGFTQFSPADGRPAEERTEVRVWYSPTAIYFGIRAYAAPGTVRAHLGDRDRGIIPDDYIEIQLGTFNDGRQAFVFGANPLGVQADGTLIEGQAKADNNRVAREQADLSPDFLWDSKGQITDFGYQLELRVPFESLRFQRADPQDWSLQLIRKSAAWGREDTWAPATRSASSFLAQHGRLVGLTGLRRGLVMDLNPVVTSTVAGARPAPDAAWAYQGGRPEVGGTVRWGVSSDVNLTGTVNPDFSQIEADASQISPDPRRAILFQEKRPFFLDGIEYFNSPFSVIYTRRVVAPIVAAKVAGRSGGTNFGVLSAVDDGAFTATGRNALYTVGRIQRDVGRRSRIGFAYTDRMEGDDANRVGVVDGRFLFGGIYRVAAAAALSVDRHDGERRTAPAWSLELERSGRTFGFRATARGLDPDFRPRAGFLDRGNLTQTAMSPSITLYGSRGALLERFFGGFTADWLWAYDDFFDGGSYLERKFHFRTSFTLRGGWNLGASLLVERFAYDPRIYADYAVAVPTATGVDTLPYNDRGLPGLPNLDLSINIDSPEIAGFELNGFMIYGRDDNFLEWSSTRIWYGKLGLAYRPTDKLRFDGSLAVISYRRPSDGTIAGDTYIPRLKTEYQISRSIFLRLVGEYSAVRRDDLRDDGRTNAPLLIRDPADGIYKRELALGFRRNVLRVDGLFSYQPSPGTVLFLGYGSSMQEDRAFSFRALDRQSDAFFAKLSYLFRL